MKYLIQDLLDLAQIKQGKFRAIISQFNVREAVATVMKIQEKQAHFKEIFLYAKFNGIAEQDNHPLEGSPIINTDEQRFKQCLLIL